MAKEIQPNLFSPGLNTEYVLKEAMHASASKSGLSRAQIVDRMEEMAARAEVKLTTGSATSLSEATLEKWLNPGDPDKRVIPLKALPIFCAVVGKGVVSAKSRS